MNVQQRIAIEKRILRHVVEQFLQRGFLLSVYDGEEYTVKKSDNKEAILAALMTTDEDMIQVWGKGAVRPRGSVQFVYGNDGWDVISDYHTALEEFMAPIMQWVEKAEGV